MLGYDWPRLHAALNDLPAALLLVAVVFEVTALIARRPALRQVGLWTLLVGVLGAVAAVVSGLQAEEHIAHGEAVHEIMETHETLAFVTLGIFGVVAVWRVAREARMGPKERGAGLLLSLIGLGVLLATAGYGGDMVFGHAAGIPTPVIQSEVRERAEGHHHGAAEAEHEHADAPDEAAGHDALAGDSVAPADSPSGHRHPPGTAPHTH